jgi:hypothetical protein
MAFGMMTKKWGLLWRPLLVNMYRINSIVQVIGRLHNYCIKERLLESGHVPIDPVAEAKVVGRETLQQTAHRLAEYEALVEKLLGFSANRHAMANRVEQLGLKRTRLA